MQETTGARLRRLREARGLTRYRLAKVSGVAESYIYRIEKDEIKNPRRDTLQKLAQGCNVTVAQLIGETRPLDTWQLVEQSLKAYIPVYSGVEVGMEPIDYVVCTRAKIPPDTLRGYRIDGLSLEPEIRNGDTIIVDNSLALEDGDLVLVSLLDCGGCVALARYSVDGSGGERLADNDGVYQIKNVSIHGVVVEYVRKLR